MSFLSPTSHRRSRIYAPPTVWDAGLLALLVLTIFTLSPWAGVILRASEGSFIQAPLHGLLMSSVPLAVFILPSRFAFLGMRRRAVPVLAWITALIVGALSWVAIDHWLSYAPPEGDLSAVFTHDTPLYAVTPPDDGIVGLTVTQHGTSWDLLHDRAVDCWETCRLMLIHGVADEVALLSSDLDHVIGRYRLQPVGEACRADERERRSSGSLHSLSGPMVLCISDNPDQSRPQLIYEVHRLNPATDPDRYTEQVRYLWRLVVRKGAVFQTVHVAGVEDTRDGGLLHPRIRGSEPMVTYFASPSLRSVAEFDVTQTGPLPTWTLDHQAPAALFAVMAQTLSLTAQGGDG